MWCPIRPLYCNQLAAYLPHESADTVHAYMTCIGYTEEWEYADDATDINIFAIASLLCDSLTKTIPELQTQPAIVLPLACVLISSHMLQEMWHFAGIREIYTMLDVKASISMFDFQRLLIHYSFHHSTLLYGIINNVDNVVDHRKRLLSLKRRRAGKHN